MTTARQALGALAVLTTATAGLSAQAYTLYGTGCGSGTGVNLTISRDSALIPGMTTRFMLDGAVGGPPTLNILGFAQTNTPMLGCTLLVQPLATQFFLADATGHAEHALTIPPFNAFTGLPIYDQWLALDPGMPSGVGFTQGACGIVANPQLTIGNFSPTTGGIGTVITVAMSGLGTTDPDDLCLRVVDFTGSSLVRVQSITPLIGGNAMVTGVLVTANHSLIAAGNMGAMRGSGETIVVPPGVKLTAPADGWGWNGAGTPQAGGRGGPFAAQPDPTQTPLVFGVVGNSILATLPPGPYLVNQQITLDVHWDVTCPGQPQVHYDHFLGTMTITANMTATELRDEVAQKMAVVFNNLWPGKTQVNVPVPAGDQLVITMVDPSCTIVSGGGSLYVQ